MTYETYLDAVRAALADLPDDDRTELLDDVEPHLAEVAAEEGESLETRLGSPESYADELRAAAGLPSRADRPARRRFRRVRAVADTVRATRAYRAVDAFLPELRPAWWVARGVLVVLAVAALTDTLLVGLVAAGGAVVLSVRLGRLGSFRGWRRGSLAVVNGLAVIAALQFALDRLPHQSGVVYVYDTDGGFPVQNVFPYDSDGRPLTGITLLDQDGRPLSDRFCTGYVACELAPTRTFPLPMLSMDPKSGVWSEMPPTPPVVFATPTATPSPAPTASPATPTRK